MRNRKTTGQNGAFFVLYTILFAISAVLVFRYFPEENMRMVWRGDGLSQHFTALCYYARWGRAVLRSILSGHPSFPTFNLHMGFGSDLFTTLQYYVIGDPFSLPAVFVPQRHMLIFHDAMIVARMYIAGLCFDRYCRFMGHRDTVGNLCGTLVYVFSSFALFGMRHPYFLNAMIWFPLLLLGAEHIFRGRRGRLFTLAVFLSCISNFYFFYMLVLMTVVYAVWRALRICLFSGNNSGRTAVENGSDGGKAFPRGIPGMACLAGKCLYRALLGTAMGACFLLPILLRFAADPRASEGTASSLLYALSYYKSLPEAFVAFGRDATLEYWTCLGFGGIGLISVILLFLNADTLKKEEENSEASIAAEAGESLPASGADSKKTGQKHTDLKLAFAGMLVLILVPYAGTVLNGFSYPSNRWTWAFAMLAGYITAVMVPAFLKITVKKAAVLAAAVAAYAGACYSAGVFEGTLAELGLAFAAVILTTLLAAVSRRLSGAGSRGNSREEISREEISREEIPPRKENGSEDLKGTLRVENGNAASEAPAVGTEAETASRLDDGDPEGKAPAVGTEAETASRLGDGDPESQVTAFGTEAERPRRGGSVLRFLQSAVLIVTILLTEAIHGYVEFVPGQMNSGVREYHSERYIEGMKASDAAGIAELVGDGTFFRYSGRNLANNISILHDVSNTQYYWSLSDEGIEQFFSETGQGNGMVHLYDNLDNRTFLDEIAGVRYYIRNDGSLLPYGYEKLEGLHYDNRKLFAEKKDDPVPTFSFSVYENQYTLPLGFTSENYFSREEYDRLSIPQRQEALMQGILLETEDIRQLQESGRLKEDAGQPQEAFLQAENDGIGRAVLSFTSRDIPCVFQPESGIEVESGQDGTVRIKVSDTEACLSLQPEDTSGLEVSVLFAGTGYEPPEDGYREDEVYTNTDSVDIRVKARRNGHSVSQKKVEYTLADNPWSTGRSDFLSCCGWTEKPLSEVRIYFSRRGTYTFRELKVIGQSMEEYPGYAEEFRKYVLGDLNLHELPGSGATNRITGTISLPESRILCVQIPRCKGLRAYVDGEEQTLLKADTMFSALVLDAGTHEVELCYTTPGLIPGAAISVFAVLLVLVETAAASIKKINAARQR